MYMSKLVFSTLLSTLIRAAPLQADQQLPTVDLGYEVHRALTYNDTFDFYRFANIRYARPPLDDLRFRAPVQPVTNRSAVQDGKDNRHCPQSVPDWLSSAFGPIGKYSAGAPFTFKAWEAAIANATVPKLQLNTETTEDCLFLDVYVPPKVFNRSCGSKEALKNGAPVLVWIHGGGFVFGSKTDLPKPSYNPAGLIQYGNLGNDDGMIYVSLNYRLGAFGFLTGDAVKKDGDLNAGLLDQRLALQWVQNNIHLFGGDASRVTLMGESGGAGAAMLQALAYGGDSKPLFSQLILQSPAPASGSAKDNSNYQGMLAQTNTSSLAELRRVPSTQLVAAGERFVASAPRNMFRYGSAYGDSFFPSPPQKIFSQGKVPRTYKVLVGLNSLEGGFFFDPTVTNETAFTLWLQANFPTSASNIDYISKSLYPPVFDGSMGYIDYATRSMTVWSDAIFHCNAELANNYFGSNSFAYEFSVTPGFHIQDLAYSFTDDTLPYPLPHPGARYTMQRMIASFVTKGTPYLYVNGTSGAPTAFPTWNQSARTIVNITNTGATLGVRTLGANATKCDFWLKGIYA